MAIRKINSRAIADGAVATADLGTNLDIAGTLDVTGVLTADGNATVAGDFTADNANATLFVDASTNKVHIGGGTSDANTSALSVVKNGGGNFIANFENTSTTNPYGVMVRDPSGSAAGYPLLQVSNSSGNHYFRVDSNTGNNYFAPGGTEKVRIDSDGLKFNGDTAAANALDDYEEGTWTPSFGTNFGTVTYTQQNGFYTKKGREVTAHFNIEWSARSTSGGGYGVSLLGLPFSTPSASAGRRLGGAVVISGFESIPMSAANYDRKHAGGYLNTSSNSFYMRFSGLGQSEVSPDGSNGTYTAGGYYYGFVTYYT